MVKLWLTLALLAAPVLGWAQEAGSADAGSGDKKGPVLYGDGAGRIWKWQAGERTWLTAEGLDLTLGGVGDQQLWGWALDRNRVRFFTLELPQKKDVKAGDKAGPKAKKPAQPPPVPVFDTGDWPVPDRADRVGDRTLLVYGALSGSPRYEVWQAGKPLAARAWDDGRVVYALALGRDDGWILAGRTSDKSPWLEVSGTEVPAPDGWRGRLTVAAWVPEAEKKLDAVGKAGPGAQTDAKLKTEAKPKAPLPVHPWAVGWGAPGNDAPRALFWGPQGWTQPAETDPPTPLGAGVFPVLGAAGDQGTLAAAGWKADDGTGVLRPWFWDGTAETIPGGAAEGLPQGFSAGGKGGAFLVVRHQSEPWFTLEDGKEQVVVEGLGSSDRVVAVEPEAPSSQP